MVILSGVNLKISKIHEEIFPILSHPGQGNLHLLSPNISGVLIINYVIYVNVHHFSFLFIVVYTLKLGNKVDYHFVFSHSNTQLIFPYIHIYSNMQNIHAVYRM